MGGMKQVDPVQMAFPKKQAGSLQPDEPGKKPGSRGTGGAPEKLRGP